MYNYNQPRDAHGRWSGGIVDSIEHQMRVKGHPADKAHALAIEIATNHGLIDARGNLTAKGREREAMGHKARVIDRAAKATGHKPSEIGYQNGRAFVK